MAKTRYQLDNKLVKVILEMLGIRTGLDKNDLLANLLSQGFIDKEVIERTLLWLANQDLIIIQTDLLSEASYYLTNEGETTRKVLRHAQISGRRIFKEAIRALETKKEELKQFETEQIAIRNRVNQMAQIICEAVNDTIRIIHQANQKIEAEIKTIMQQDQE